METIQLDIRTLSFITTITALVIALGLFAFGSVQKRFRGFTQFALGSASTASGMFLLGLRDVAPDLVSVVLANTLLVVGFVLYFEGLRRFFGAVRDLHPASILLTFLHVGLFYYFTFTNPSVNDRIIVISAVMGFLALLCAREIIRKRAAHWDAPVIFTALLYSIFATYQAFRILWTIEESPIQSFMAAGTVHAYAFIFLLFLIIGTAFGFIWMVSKDLEDSLLQLANIDQLTNVLNRRGITSIVEQMEEDFSGKKNEMGIILVDIDEFKDWNDNYGHQVGDEVLKHTAQEIQGTIREGDILARFGGDEFIVLLPNTPPEDSLQLAHRMRDMIQTITIEVGGTAEQVAASFGVAGCSEETNSFTDLVRCADLAMYRSKHKGRNQVTQFTKMKEMEKYPEYKHRDHS